MTNGMTKIGNINWVSQINFQFGIIVYSYDVIFNPIQIVTENVFIATYYEARYDDIDK